VASGLIRPGCAQAADAEESVKVTDERSVTAVQTDTPPVIDGRLDDACWTKAGKTSTLFNERNFEPCTQDTIIYIAYDMENLYIAFECLESDTSSIRAYERRDDRIQIWRDDWVELKLDTFHDHRSCYVFMTNAAGAKLDAREGVVQARFGEIGWNCDWKVGTSIEEDRWFAEMSIPLAELLFERKDNQTWGVNFMRDEQRLQEEGFWSLRRDDTYDAHRFGQIEGLNLSKAVPRRRPEFSPYVSGMYEFGDNKHTEANIGIDIAHKFSTNFTTALTVNPDFGQVETDADDIVLRDIERFLPERRPYFKEGLELFRTPLPYLFYSRRLFDIDYGAKISGKHGPYSLALLDVEGQIVRDGERLEGNYLAARAMRDIGADSFIGVLATNSERRDGYNRLASVDGFFRLPNDLDLSAQYARSCRGDELDESDDWTDDAFLVSLSRGEDPFWMGVRYTDIGEDFYPDLAYIPRTNIRGPSVWMRFSDDREQAWYDRFYAYFNARLYENQDGRTILRDYDFQSSLRMKNGLEYTLWGASNFHDPYDNREIGAMFGFNTLDRWHSTEFGAATGEFEDTRYRRYIIEKRLAPLDNFTVEFDGEFRQEEELDGSGDSIWLTRAVCNYSFGEDIWLKAAIQFSDQRQRNFNIIFKWGALEDVDWYLVYNEVETSDDPLSRMLFTKLVYTF